MPYEHFLPDSILQLIGGAIDAEAAPSSPSGYLPSGYSLGPGLKALGTMFGVPSLSTGMVKRSMMEDPSEHEAVGVGEMLSLAGQTALAKAARSGGGLMQFLGDLPLVPPEQPWPENRPWPGVSPELSLRGREIASGHPNPDISNLPSVQRDVIFGLQYLMGGIPGIGLAALGGPVAGPLMALGYGGPAMMGYKYDQYKDPNNPEQDERARLNAMAMGLLQAYGLGGMKKPHHD